MKIRHFSDTDTALIELADAPFVEKKEITANLYIDLDENGNLVTMTIEHAKKQVNISEVSYFANGKEQCLTNHSSGRLITAAEFWRSRQSYPRKLISPRWLSRATFDISCQYYVYFSAISLRTAFWT